MKTIVHRSKYDPVAVFFDFGGVLTTSLFEAFGNFSERISGDRDLVERILLADEEVANALVEHEEGRSSDEDFEVALARKLLTYGVDIKAYGLIEQMQADVKPDRQMLQLVGLVKEAGYHVALVSNSLGRNCYAGFDLESMFDVQVISGIEGVRKPSQIPYLIACDRLGISPFQAIMVDDMAENIVSAHELGMGAILHSRSHDTAARLADLLPQLSFAY